MRILLTVPVYKQPFDISAFENPIFSVLKNHDVDLIVFPEGYYYVETPEDLLYYAEGFSKDYQTAILLGGTIAEDQSQWAAYYNINAEGDETRSKLYCKHSTAPKIAFERKDYAGLTEEFYKPVLYKGNKIQFNICHDIYLPLLAERLQVEACDYFINLTGGNVKMSKWHNVFKGRSLESNAAFLCTMGDDPESKQDSSSFVYINGEEIAWSESYSTNDDSKPSRYQLYDFTNWDQLRVFDPVNKQIYSDKLYTDFSIGFGEQNADITIEMDTINLVVNQLAHAQDANQIKVQKKAETINIYPLDCEQLFNRIALYDYEMDSKEHHIVVYHSDEPIYEDDALALAKLRAIENRVGIIVVAPNIQFGVRTNRYKDIQLFQPTNNKISFSFEFMHGYHSTFTKANNGQYIGTKQKGAYLSLLD